MDASPNILVLTPLKDATPFLASYVAGLEKLTYPAARISLGFLESDSRDGSHDAMRALEPQLAARFRRVSLWKRDYGFHMPEGVPRYAPAYQLQRRAILARARNQLLFRALDDEDWVLWLDVDVIDYPADVVERLLATGRDIVHPHCVTEPGGKSFDRNAWRDHGKQLLQDLRGRETTRLDAVGGTMLLVRADRHRDGLVFPPYLYGLRSRWIRPVHPIWGEGEIETEGLGMMAKDMGLECWGLPDLEILHADF